MVVGYDTWALLRGKETLSAGFARASRTRWGRLAVQGGWLGLTWHLMRGDHHVLPERYYARYRQIHPLWVLHDRAVTRANARILLEPLIPVSQVGTGSNGG